MSEGLKKEIFPMDGNPAEITIYGNYFLTQGDVYWRDRYFYFRLKHSYASFHEYTGEGWPERQEEQIQEWGMDYPQDDITSKEVAKLFWHLVVTTDPKYLEAHRKWVEGFYANLAIKGEQKTIHTHEIEVFGAPCECGTRHEYCGNCDWVEPCEPEGEQK